MAVEAHQPDVSAAADTGDTNNVHRIKPDIQIEVSQTAAAAALAASAAQNAASMSLKTGGGGGTSGGMSDDWKDSVNTQLARLHVEVRHLLYGCLAGAVALCGVGFELYQSVSGKLTDLSVSQAKLETRLNAVDGRLQSIDSKLDRLLDERRSNSEPKR